MSRFISTLLCRTIFRRSCTPPPVCVGSDNPTITDCDAPSTARTIAYGDTSIPFTTRVAVQPRRAGKRSGRNSPGLKLLAEDSQSSLRQENFQTAAATGTIAKPPGKGREGNDVLVDRTTDQPGDNKQQRSGCPPSSPNSRGRLVSVEHARVGSEVDLLSGVSKNGHTWPKTDHASDARCSQEPK